MENYIGNIDKKSTTTSRNAKTDEKRWDKKKKGTQLKQTVRFGEINQKVLEKEGRLKRYQDRIK